MPRMTRSRLFARSLVLGLVLVGPAFSASCNGSSTEKPAPAASGGSAGAVPEPEPIQCGATTCDPVKLIKGLSPDTIPACCAGAETCGLDSSPLNAYGISFTEVCQPKHQPGDATLACPDSPPLMVPNTNPPLSFPPFKGCCCADTKTCGYLLDKLANIIDVGLGCVDSSPFLDGGAPTDCDSAGGGASGTGG